MRRSSLLLSAMLVVSASLAAGLTAQAADTPEGAVDALLDTILAKDWDGLAPLVCEAKRDEVAAQFDLTQVYGGEGIDAGPLVDAMALRIDGRAVSLLSEVEGTASVQLRGTLHIAVDAAVAREWVRQSLEATGQPTDDTTVEQFLAFFLESMEEGSDLTSTVDVTREAGDWRVCDDLVDDPGASFDPGASLPPPVDPLCDLMTPAELNAATGLLFVSATPYDGGCSWDSDAADEYYNVSIYREDGDLEFIKQVWTDGQDVTIGGMPAWATPDGTWVDLGNGLLTIMPYLDGAASTASVDPVAFARTVGDIVVARLS